jgi:hypothetical protein
VSDQKTGLSLENHRAVIHWAEINESDGGALESIFEKTSDDPEFTAGLNRVKTVKRERLRADVASLASAAMATLRKLITNPDVPPAVRLRACLAVLHATDALTIEEIGPTSAETVKAKRDRKRFMESFGA